MPKIRDLNTGENLYGMEIPKWSKHNCRPKFSREKPHNPKYMNGIIIKNQKKQKMFKDKKLLGDIKQSLYNDMIDKKGYIWCEECKRTFEYLELHHIIFRSECVNHPKKHSKINSILLCRNCHKEYHDHKPIREKWIIKRKLYDHFEHIKKV